MENEPNTFSFTNPNVSSAASNAIPDTADLSLLEAQLMGRTLYGDSLSPSEIQAWYTQEENGYYDLVQSYASTAKGNGPLHYEYEALNRVHAIDWLLRRKIDCCVALGCAAGDDVSVLAPIVNRFVAIEPAEKWWRSEIGGKPAKYIKPSISGAVDLDSGCADAAISLGVLHHIPNVTDVVREIVRVLRPGGIFVVREPITWLGDWRKKRPGMTPNERGLPLAWFERTVRESGFNIVRRHLCMFRPVSILAKMAGVSHPYASRAVTLIDWLFSEMLSWNVRYRRHSFFDKLAPASAFWILEKR